MKNVQALKLIIMEHCEGPKEEIKQEIVEARVGYVVEVFTTHYRAILAEGKLSDLITRFPSARVR